MATNTPVVKEGWIFKKGAVMTSWKRRFCKLTGNCLIYSDSPTAAAPKGSIPIGRATVVEVGAGKSSKYPHNFSLSGGAAKRTFYLAGANPEERDEWVAAIRSVASGEATKQGNPQPATEAKVKKTVEPAAEAAAVPEPATVPEPAAEPAAAEPAAAEPAAAEPAAAEPAAAEPSSKKEDGESEPDPHVPNTTSPPTTTEDWAAYRQEIAKEPAVSEPPPVREAGVVQTIRVFISSTFIDEHSERDELVRRVFNELNSKFRDRWLQIVPVDLRWGVSSEETSIIQQTCLNEIDHCRVHPNDAPWFIGLRGERYGWVQNKYDLPEDYEQPEQFGWLNKLATKAPVSITSLEVYHAIIGARRSEESAKKGPHALVLNRNNGFKKKVPENFQWIFDYEYLPEGAEKPDEVTHQYTRTPQCQNYADDLARLNEHLHNSPDVVKSVDYFPTFGEEGDGSKAEKTGQLPSGKMFGVGFVGSLTDFGKAAYDFLYNQIDKEYPALEVGTALDIERVQHKSVIRSRSQGFLGREPILDQMTEFCQRKSVDGKLMAVWGPPGCGKSALMAQFCNITQASTLKDKNTFVLSHIIGATSSSQTASGTLRRFCEELKIFFGDKKTEIPLRFDKIRSLWYTMLEKMKKEKRKKLIIIIDAVNQMDPSNDAHLLQWIPLPLPDNVRVIVSTLPEENNVLANIRARPLGPEELEVPLLDENDRKELVVQTLAKYHKKLTTDDSDGFLGNQMALLLSKEQAGSPLYLIAAVEELRNFGIYERMSGFIKDTLPGTVVTLFKHLLDRLENDHGKELVEKAFGLLSEARAGLLEIEMIEILENIKWKTEPISNFSRLYTSLAVFIATGGSGLMQLFHQQLLKIVVDRYVGTTDRKEQLHSELADYFLSKVDPDGSKSFKGGYDRGFSELCYHMMYAHQWERLSDTVSNLQFLEARCAAGGGFDIVNDLLRAEELDSEQKLPPIFAQFRQFFVANASLLAAHPEQVVTRASAYPFKSDVAESVWKTPFDKPFVQFVNKPATADPSLMTLRLTGDKATRRACFIHFSPDASVIYCVGGKRAVLFDPKTGQEKRVLLEGGDMPASAMSPDGKQVALFANDRKRLIHIFDVSTGDVIYELTTTSDAKSMAFSPDGKTLCVLTKEFETWDLATQTQVKSVTAPRDATMVEYSGDKIFLMQSDNLKAYNAETLSEVKEYVKGTLHNHSGHCAVSPSGKIVAVNGYNVNGGGGRNTFIAVDEATDAILKTEKYDNMIIDMHFAWDATSSHLVVGLVSNDVPLSKIILYDVSTWEKMAEFASGVSSICAVAINWEAKLMGVSGKSGEARLFDIPTVIANTDKQEQRYKPETHEGAVNFVGYTPDCKSFFTSASDLSSTGSGARVIAWDTNTGLHTHVHEMNARHDTIMAVTNNEPAQFVKKDGIGYAHTPWNVQVFDFPDFSQTLKFGFPDEAMHDDPNIMCFSADDSQLLINVDNKTGEIWTFDMKTGQKVGGFPNFGGESTSELVAFKVIPDGIAAASKKAVIVMGVDGGSKWKFDDNKAAPVLRQVESFTTSADGSLLIAAGRGKIAAFDWKSSDPVKYAFECHHEENIKAIACSGDVVMTGGDDRHIYIRNISDGSLVTTFVGDAPVTSLAICRELSSSGAVQFAAGFGNGETKALRLIMEKSQYDPVDKQIADRDAAIEEHHNKPPPAAGDFTAAKNLIQRENVPDGEGSKVKLIIDGEEVVPTSDKLFWKTKWVLNKPMSPNPTFLLEWDKSKLGDCTSCSCMIAEKTNDKEVNFSKQFCPMTGGLLTPGTELKYEGTIMAIGGDVPQVSRIPPGSYCVMVNANGSSGMDSVHVDVTVF